jgi:hypothetical protein
LVLRGHAAFLKPLTPESYAEAIGYFERALALDPGFVAAEASLAGALAGRVLEGMTGTRAADLERAEALSEAANCRTRKNGRNLPMMDGIAHAIATCDRIERALTVAAGRAKHALVENADRTAEHARRDQCRPRSARRFPSGCNAAEASAMSDNKRARS